jgi:F0F1-type ATP synthase membrane subunit b/b'
VYALSPADAAREAQAILAQARKEAGEIRTAADKEAEGIRQTALNFRNEIRASVRIQLEGFIAKL